MSTLSMIRRLAIAAACVIVAVVLGLGSGSPRTPRDPAARAVPAGGPRPRAIDPAFTEALGRAGRTAKFPFAPASASDTGEVALSGSVVDAKTGAAVGNVEVVFRSEEGEQTTVAGADGRYKIVLPRGRYRAFVRDESVLSVGRPEVARLPGLPSAEIAGVPDEALMPLVVAARDADNIDLAVVRGGTIVGQVIDPRGRPIPGAVVRARGTGGRPAIATDLAETDATGRFELHVPPGDYLLDATHERYAGVGGFEDRLQVTAGAKIASTLTMTAGCVISGKVVDARGKAAGDGAIEKRWGVTDLEFGPAGRIEADGSFRWVTTDEIDVTLRAWPWQSPPSPSRTFACRDGARFANVVFQLADRAPDIEGTLTDETGAPVPFAFVDFAPQDPGGIGQQERTDALGRWRVFNMPPGRYRVSASAVGHGVTIAAVVAPQRDVALQLGGVGRIEGTTTLLGNGTFELDLMMCADTATGRNGIVLAQQHRLVEVVGGRFTIDDVPACTLVAVATWREQRVRVDVEVPPGAAGTVEVPVGPPRAKTVHGVVRDESGRPAANVEVTARYQTERAVRTRTDGTGHYSLRTFSGATITADGSAARTGTVGMADVDDEEIDLAFEPSTPGEGWDD